MKRIGLILLSLTIVLAVLLVIVNRNREVKKGIVIRQEGTERNVTFTQLNILKANTFTTARGDNYSGYLLSDILDSQKVSFHKYLVLFSNDGGSLRLNAEDIPNAYFILMDDTDEPALRLIISSDEFGQRWLKYIKTIEVN